MNSYSSIVISTPAPHVAQLTLSRPSFANALSRQMGDEVAQFFSTLAKDTRVVIITGEGKHFCAGADLKERKGMTNQQWYEQHHAFELALHAILACPVPVIAAVNGAAFGGGLEIALACDFIYASATARFALSETTLGIIPGMGGTQHLPRAIGTRRASELIFLGQAFSASEAEQYGMVNKSCEPDALISEVIAISCRIAANAPLALRAAKKAIYGGIHLPINDALSYELTQYQTLLDTTDRHEGINAFNEKRKPHFTGS